MSRQCERQMVTLIDEWKPMTMEEIRVKEEENRKELQEKIKSAEIATAQVLIDDLVKRNEIIIRFTAGVK